MDVARFYFCGARVVFSAEVKGDFAAWDRPGEVHQILRRKSRIFLAHPPYTPLTAFDPPPIGAYLVTAGSGAVFEIFRGHAIG
jgi:hypothetical protein